ncbi:MAG: YtxH domain-containing protein [Gemmatimonadota bacterium]
MRRHHEYDGERYVVIEKHGSDVGSLLLGVLIGAGVALLFAPQSGPETRRAIRRKAQEATDAVKGVADDVTTQVSDTFEAARSRVEEQIDSARNAIVRKKRQVTRAMEAGREAAAEARGELEQQIAETKAAYNAGADVARTARAVDGRPPVSRADTNL